MYPPVILDTYPLPYLLTFFFLISILQPLPPDNSPTDSIFQKFWVNALSPTEKCKDPPLSAQ